MLRSDVLVVQKFCFLGSVGQHAHALVAQREVHGGGELLANILVVFDLLAD